MACALIDHDCCRFSSDKGCLQIRQGAAQQGEKNPIGNSCLQSCCCCQFLVVICVLQVLMWLFICECLQTFGLCNCNLSDTA